MPDTATQTTTVRLLLDEDVWPGLASVLRERGFDAVHVSEVQRGGLPDADQLTYAAQTERAIMTHNIRDFVPLAAEWFLAGEAHAGMVLSPQLEKGELLRRTERLLQAVSAKEMGNSVRFLSDYG
jgi:hypothetical protein